MQVVYVHSIPAHLDIHFLRMYICVLYRKLYSEQKMQLYVMPYTQYVATLCTRHFPNHSSERSVLHTVLDGAGLETVLPSLMFHYHLCHLTATTHWSALHCVQSTSTNKTGTHN